MIEFQINDMAGNYCAETITRVVKETVPTASIDIDLPNHLVRIDGISNPKVVERAIREVGYTPLLMP